MEVICFSDTLIPLRSRAPLTHLLTCHKVVWMKLNTCERLEVDDNSKSKYFICEIFYWKPVANRPLICFSPAGAKAVRWNSPHPRLQLKTKHRLAKKSNNFLFLTLQFQFFSKSPGLPLAGILTGTESFLGIEDEFVLFPCTLFSHSPKHLSRQCPWNTATGSRGGSLYVLPSLLFWWFRMIF